LRRILLTLLVLLAGAAPAGAACPQTTLEDVEDEVMCPVCGTPLELATEAPQAVRERELIRRLVDRCQSKEQVKAVLVAEFGDEVLAVPDDEGFDLAAYLVPALAIAAALLALGIAALRWRGARRGPDAPERSPSTAVAERLESDLERYDL
jgi:cytochrome c-type biogenesis protein CcmH